MKDRKTLIIILIILLIGSNSLFSSGNKEKKDSEVEESIVVAEYHRLTAEQAKEIFDSNPNSIIIDVRTEEEFNSSRIPKSINIPLSIIENEVLNRYPDKNTKLYLYCRSGNRSNQAANLLVNLGYTNVYDFGGIINWPFEIIQ